MWLDGEEVELEHCASLAVPAANATNGKASGVASNESNWLFCYFDPTPEILHRGVFNGWPEKASSRMWVKGEREREAKHPVLRNVIHT